MAKKFLFGKGLENGSVREVLVTGDLRSATVLNPFEVELECLDGTCCFELRNAVVGRDGRPIPDELLLTTKQKVLKLIQAVGRMTSSTELQEGLRQKPKAFFSDRSYLDTGRIRLIKKEG